MPDQTTPLDQTERERLVAALTTIRDRLDNAGELLAAVHVTHALDCLDPDSPINRQSPRRPG